MFKLLVNSFVLFIHRDLRLSGNDISIVAKHALDGARELKNLNLQENPLSCDCTIREFASWLQVVKLESQDLLTITCVTPPKLEGAPLIQVPMEMLNCDMENVEKDNADIIEQLEAMAKQNHSTHIKDLSEEVSALQTDCPILLKVFSTTDHTA